MLKFVIRTSTSSMTSVPKPLKYLAPFYGDFKTVHVKIKDEKVKKQCADVISVLAMAPGSGDQAREERECLRYCLLGKLSLFEPTQVAQNVLAREFHVQDSRVSTYT